MPSVRTQIYLTENQRGAIEALIQREHRSLASVVRDALDAYLQENQPSASEALARTFGALPDFSVPARSEWDRG